MIMKLTCITHILKVNIFFCESLSIHIQILNIYIYIYIYLHIHIFLVITRDVNDAELLMTSQDYW